MASDWFKLSQTMLLANVTLLRSTAEQQQQQSIFSSKPAQRPSYKIRLTLGFVGWRTCSEIWLSLCSVSSILCAGIHAVCVITFGYLVVKPMKLIGQLKLFHSKRETETPICDQPFPGTNQESFFFLRSLLSLICFHFLLFWFISMRDWSSVSWFFSWFACKNQQISDKLYSCSSLLIYHLLSCYFYM